MGFAINPGQALFYLVSTGEDTLDLEVQASTGQWDNDTEGLLFLGPPAAWNVTRDIYYKTIAEAIELTKRHLGNDRASAASGPFRIQSRCTFRNASIDGGEPPLWVIRVGLTS